MNLLLKTINDETQHEAGVHATPERFGNGKQAKNTVLQEYKKQGSIKKHLEVCKQICL